MGHFFRNLGPVAIAAMVAPATGHAANDVEALRAEIAAIKAGYAQRVTALEARIDQLETTVTVAAAAPVEPPLPAPSAPARNSSAFNPSISVILAGNYADLSQDPGDFNFAGFMPSGGEIGPGERSFNLGESEVTFAASVDPYFTAALTMALSAEGEIGVEEAFARTTSLPTGFSVKGGRFFSGFGYLWQRAVQPLPLSPGRELPLHQPIRWWSRTTPWSCRIHPAIESKLCVHTPQFLQQRRNTFAPQAEMLTW